MAATPAPPERIGRRLQPYLGVALYFATVIGGVFVFYGLTVLLLSAFGMDAGQASPLFGG